jgi:tetratricopeptide (TPR) repeat protein
MRGTHRRNRLVAGSGVIVLWTVLLVALGLPALGLALPLAVGAFVLGGAARDRWPSAFVLRSAARRRLRAASALGRRLGGRALSSVRTMRVAPSRREAWELNRAALDHRRAGRLEAAIACCEHALALATRLRERRDQALTLNSLGLALAQAGATDRAGECFLQAASILRELEQRHLEGQVLANLGALRERQQQRDEAHECWRRALALLDAGSREHGRLSQRFAAAVEP